MMQLGGGYRHSSGAIVLCQQCASSGRNQWQASADGISVRGEGQGGEEVERSGCKSNSGKGCRGVELEMEEEEGGEVGGVTDGGG